MRNNYHSKLLAGRCATTLNSSTKLSSDRPIIRIFESEKMASKKEIILDSAPSQPDDDFWLKQGRKMFEGSIDAVREAAKALMAGLELLLAVYFGILGFADFIPEEMPLVKKSLFLLPLLLWLIALYDTLRVMMTQRLDINLRSPDDVRKKSESALLEKQRNLQGAFWMLAIGLVVALLLLIFRLKI